jgi:membrane protease YdiL (CAAX protease family)
VAALVVAVGLRSTVVPGAAHLWFNLATAGALGLLARRADLSWEELGLAQRDLAAGLRWGVAALGLVTVVVVVAALLPGTSAWFEDDRAEVATGAFLRRALLVIPLGTVLLEELAFRGVLLGLLLRTAGARAAAVGSAVLFGWWHVITAWNSAAQSAALGEAAASTGGRLLTVAGTVAATTVAGLVFAWLRLGSRSLLAPVLAHVATNSVTFTAAWLLAR